MKHLTLLAALAGSFLALLSAAAPAQAASVLYVTPTGSDTSSCDSWSNACSLQHALAAAVATDQIWVMKGTYKPTTGTDRTATFQLKNGVAMYGGFVGTETQLRQRSWIKNLTILSGNIGARRETDNIYHVVTASDTDNTAVLDGFAVTAGNANGTGGCGDQECGSGMFDNGGSPTIANIVFTGNLAWRGGGGMYIAGGSPTLTNVTFASNQALEAAAQGAGLYVSNGSPTLTNVTFSDNSAPSAAGMYTQSGNAALTNVTFSGNSAVTKGGGMYIAGGSPTLTHVTFSGNKATDASGRGGGIYSYGASPAIRNAILWGNTAPDGGQIYVDGGSPAVSDSVVQGGFVGGTNILTTDPQLLALASNGGYSQTMALGAGSSAINAANLAYCPATDQRGSPRRVARGYCDIGAFEAQPSSVIATAGTPQTTHVNTEFPRHIVALVRDAYQNPLAGVEVTFSPPPGPKGAAADASAFLSGPQLVSLPAVVITDGRGQAYILLTANGTPGTYYVTATVEGVKLGVSYMLTNAKTMENEYRGIAYDRWTGVPDPYASGGTYRWNDTANASALFKFTGTSVTWLTLKGPAMGATSVYIDDINKGTLDHSAPTMEYNIQEPFGGLPSGPHRIVLSAVSGATAIDAFKAGGVTTQDDSSDIRYASWIGFNEISATGGNYRASDTGNAEAVLTLVGGRFTWVTAKGPDMGQARVYVDGTPREPDNAFSDLIDLYDPAAQWKVPITFSGLSAGPHEIKVLVTGTKNEASSGTKVVVDAFQ